MAVVALCALFQFPLAYASNHSERQRLPSLVEIEAIAERSISYMDKQIKSIDNKVDTINEMISNERPNDIAEAGSDAEKAARDNIGNAVSTNPISKGKAIAGALESTGHILRQQSIADDLYTYQTDGKAKLDRLTIARRDLAKTRAKLTTVRDAVISARKRIIAEAKAKKEQEERDKQAAIAAAAAPAPPGPSRSSSSGNTRAGEGPRIGPRDYGSSRSEGPRNEGPKNNGPRNEGPKNDGPKNDGPKNDGPKNDGPKNDGPKNDGQDIRGLD